jgi:hypothetical protein
MMIQERKPYPFDLTKLGKGSVIQSSEIERVTGGKADSRNFGLDVMTAKGMLDRQFRDAGITLTTRTSKGTIIICDDSDASRYNRKSGRSGLRRFGRSHVRNLAVDVSKLTEEERKDHEKTLLTNGRLLAAVSKIRHQPLLPAPKKRETPTQTEPAPAQG